MKRAVPILSAVAISSASAVTVTIDYRYDTNDYFANNLNARNALEAAAQRWSNVLDAGNLQAAAIDSSNNRRIGFNHPSTGASYQVSGAADSASDPIISAGAPAADEYRTINWSADEWILYPGARSLGSAGIGGTGTGTNFTSTFSDPNSHLNRGFGGFSSSRTGSDANLPTWGGIVSFNTGTTWSFSGDFYSVALHEIGHALGLATDWQNFTQHIAGADYSGPAALAAFNADNNASATSIPLVSATNFHWLDNGNTPGSPAASQSLIYENGSPDLAGTVGAMTLQDLNMEPIANFVSGTTTISRIELTNVDIGSAEDVGWTVIQSVNVVPEPSSAVFAIGALGLMARRRR